MAPAHTAFGGADEPGYDLSAKIGGSLGSLKVESAGNTPPNAAKTETYALGGIPVSLALNIDAMEKLSFAVGPAVLFDAPNSVVLRQSIEIGTTYHLLGGSRRLSRNGDAVSLVATSPWNFSVGVKISLNNYSARIQDVEFSGSAFETKVGIEYRKDVTQNSAFGSEINTLVMAFPSSVTRIRYQAVEFLGFWRLQL
jgi:hypothetical protein